MTQDGLKALHIFNVNFLRNEKNHVADMVLFDLDDETVCWQ